ncbi:MAG: ABC transporter substrate-binding protein [Chloroflexi bacterium]|nr:ABC transporter substrate-binding protein [Chloroflexota bacterium]
MVKSTINMLASEISHMPLHLVWRDSGVTQKHGFDLTVHVANADVADQPFVQMNERAPKLLDGTYDFLSGLHHEPYHYRARGDKRLVYLAQAQNDWDDRVIALPEIQSAKDLEGKRFIVTSRAPCVSGNLKHSLQLAGADLSQIEFIEVSSTPGRRCGAAVEALADGVAVAASVDPPFDLQGEKRGLHRLELPSVPVIHNATICANGDWVQQEEETTLAFLRSMIDAIYFFKTEKSASCEILERSLTPMIGLEGFDEVEHVYDVWAGLLSPKPFPHPLAVWNVYNLDVAHDPSVNFIGPFEIWDTSYLRDIDNSGYIDDLYGSAQAAENPAINVAI